MVDYRKMYMGLLVAVCDVAEHLEQQNCGLAYDRALLAIEQAEDAYIEAEDDVQDE